MVNRQNAWPGEGATHRVDFRYAPEVQWTCIGRPDDPHKTLVGQDGALLVDFDRDPDRYGTFRFRRTLGFHIQSDRKPIGFSQRTESARVPIVTTTIEYPKAVLELVAVGHRDREDRRRSDVVRWTIRAKPGEELVTGLWLHIQQMGRRFTPATMAAGRRVYSVAHDGLPRGGGLGELYPLGEEPAHAAAIGPLALFSTEPLGVASPPDYGPSSGLVTSPELVVGATSLSGTIVLPFGHEEVGGIDDDWGQAAFEAERQFWTGYALQPLAMEIPDTGIADLVTASARNIVQAREIKDGLPEFQVGPTVYRGLWVVDGHFFLEAARYLGLDDDADRGLRALMRRANAETGAIEIIPGHVKETGVALSTLARQAELSGDFDYVDSVWSNVRKALGYIRSLREASKARGPSAPEYGLTPLAVGDGGLGGRRAEYTNALGLLTGLKDIARTAGIIGQDRDAAAFAHEYDDLLATFRRHAQRDMRQLEDGTPYLPMLMPGGSEHPFDDGFVGTPKPWRRTTPGTATWALAHAIYPGEVFPPDDPLVQNFLHLLEQLDDHEEVPATTGFLTYRSVWAYSASFYAHVWLYAGKPEKAVDYLYGFANHAAPTRVWREEQSHVQTQNGQMVGDMPHNWASVEFIRLVRHLLVFERGETLELLPALPREWLQPERPVRLESTPTRFGPVSLTLDVHQSGAWTIDLRFDTGWARRPSGILLHLPPHAPPTVTLDGEIIAAAGGVAELPWRSVLQITGQSFSTQGQRANTPVREAQY